ncbi:hypothetical protein Ppa06_45240 [Planomonospora parontospora subsp. parontospora]|uniref:Chitinase n=2 Tax=Planomonospora parontospora TaxID=58119 RepID=A0AA37BKQ0_9ACTN|nr:hypothetical protein [Planomonospora parontospora]GGK85699.1 hypothetical protein GCM10010126_51120 [Planomonospora parontospora]GII10726.1 hypothetical protein Ppa06_45240 [Planomonospora parontospora subsp. parontospora]
MSVATDRSSARHAREPGTPPRALIVLASGALATVTGAALWLLPTETGEWGRPARAKAVAPLPAARTASGRTDAPAVPSPAAGPSGFVTFVDAVHDPFFHLPRAARQSGGRWFTLGHLTAGQDGCTPRWGGHQDQGVNPVANRLGRLRTAGGDAGLAFGGSAGRELASACPLPDRLAAAYRQVVGVFDVAHIDFEVRDSADHEAVRRRAAAISALQRETAGRGRPLAVSFTLPLTGRGLSPQDQLMLRTTREAGARITAVNLMVPLRPAAPGRNRLRPVAAAVRAAQPQIARALGERSAWRRIALTPVLAGPSDLSPADARKLAGFAARHDLAWISTRGAVPAPEVARLLAAPPL